MNARSILLVLASLSLLLLLLISATAFGSSLVAPVPIVGGLNPNFGGAPGGTSVILSGTGFTGATTVSFGPMKATRFTVDSDNQITAVVPAQGAGVVQVCVTTAGGTSSTWGSGNDFTYVPRYQQPDSHFLYKGSWTPISSSAYSGGSYRYTATVGSSVVIAFKGSSFAWVGKSGPNQGIAEVTIDQRQTFAVDLYSPATQYRKAVWSCSDLDIGVVHTVEIRYSGVKNVASSGTTVNVDAFDIAGTLVTCSRVQQSDSRLFYSGNSWSTLSTSGASGGSYKRANYGCDSVTIAFESSWLDVYATMGTTMGVVDVYLDGNLAKTIDLHSTTTRYKQRIWSYAGDADGVWGKHYVTLKRSAQCPAGKYINLDYIELVGDLLPTRIEETNPHLPYAGTWNTLSSSYYSGGSFRYTNTTGSSVAIGFNGTCLSLIAKKGPNYGIAKITLDGGEPFFLDLYSATTVYKQWVWSTGPVHPGNHAVLIEWTGTKRTAATKTNINVDAFVIIGTLNELR